MTMLQHALYELALSEHAERVRRSEKRRRVLEARSEASRQTAAPTERRFSFFRFRLPSFRLRQA
jgi:hypothetical protein